MVTIAWTATEGGVAVGFTVAGNLKEQVVLGGQATDVIVAIEIAVAAPILGCVRFKSRENTR